MITTYAPTMVNRVIAAICARLFCEVAKTIEKFFSKTKLVPLAPPTSDIFSGTATMSSLQYGIGKKAAELNVAILDSLILVHKKIHSKDGVVLLKEAKKSNRSLLVRSAAFDEINKSLVIPAHEFKDI